MQLVSAILVFGMKSVKLMSLFDYNVSSSICGTWRSSVSNRGDNLFIVVILIKRRQLGQLTSANIWMDNVLVLIKGKTTCTI